MLGEEEVAVAGASSSHRAGCHGDAIWLTEKWLSPIARNRDTDPENGHGSPVEDNLIGEKWYL